MISEAHFVAMCEQVSWDHAMHMSEQLASNDNYILSVCNCYNTTTTSGLIVDNDVDAEPWFSIRKICVNSLQRYYKENA